MDNQLGDEPRIKDLIFEIKELHNQISLMNKTIINLENKVENTNNVLINHIGFIDSVFNSIKRPLYFIMNVANKFLALEDSEQINNQLINNQ